MELQNHYDKLARMYLNAHTNGYYKPAIRISKGKAEIDITVSEQFFHSAGAVHGSVYFKVLDDAAYFAASSVIRDAMIVTASFNLYFIRPITKGVMHGAGTLAHRASRLIIVESKIVDDSGTVIAQGSATFMKTDIALDEKVGYF